MSTAIQIAIIAICALIFVAIFVRDKLHDFRTWQATPLHKRRYGCMIRFVGSSARNRDEMTCQLTAADYEALVAAMAARQPYTTPGGTLVATDKITRVVWDGPRNLLKDGTTDADDNCRDDGHGHEAQQRSGDAAH